jgi:deazaflavin-dependent oxidoreductase (nitroreductase family)
MALTRAERFDGWLSRSLPRIGPRLHRFAYRATAGRVGGTKRGVPVALLTTTGRRSGEPRTTPVMVLADGERHLTVGSNAGFAPSPAWLLNLLADPRATLRLRGSELHVVARVLEGSERAACWERLIAHNPLYEDFQSRTARQTAVVALEPAQTTANGLAARPRPRGARGS